MLEEIRKIKGTRLKGDDVKVVPDTATDSAKNGSSMDQTFEQFGVSLRNIKRRGIGRDDEEVKVIQPGKVDRGTEMRKQKRTNMVSCLVPSVLDNMKSPMKGWSHLHSETNSQHSSQD